MAIGDDFSYDTLIKSITHDSGSTVYSANLFYSWLMDEFDDLIQMDDVVPISAQTPTAYSLINGWFLDYGDGSNAHEYLDGGALESVGWNGAIKMVPYTATTSFGASDKGETLTGTTSTDTGVILSYDNRDAVDDGVVWLRTTDAFDDASENYTVSNSSAAGSITPSSTGENLWTNLYTLGTLEGSTSIICPPLILYKLRSLRVICNFLDSSIERILAFMQSPWFKYLSVSPKSTLQGTSF